MKRCPYCGKQYSDDATVCAVDGQSLDAPEERKNAAGEGNSEQNDAGFSRLGKFNVLDAEHFLKRFEEENIRFEINRDDSFMREMSPVTAMLGGYSGMAPMIEIFVRREDAEKAKAIINEDAKV